VETGGGDGKDAADSAPLILRPLAFHFEERIWGPGCWTIFFPIFITKKNRKNVPHQQ
jgi:hypothetical protein